MSSCVRTSCVLTSWAGTGGGGGRRRRTGCRTKNKNPTQRCGEKHSDSPKRNVNEANAQAMATNKSSSSHHQLPIHRIHRPSGLPK